MSDKRQFVLTVINCHPHLSNRAIAKLAKVAPATVNAVRNQLSLLPATLNMSTVYRCYGKRSKKVEGTLLYVGCSYDAFLQQAMNDTAPWYKDVVTIRLTHYSTERAALYAAIRAIYRDQPKYYQSTPELQRYYEFRKQQRADTLRIKKLHKPQTKPPQRTAPTTTLQISVVTDLERQTALQRHAEMYQQAAARSGKPARPRPRQSSSGAPAAAGAAGLAGQTGAGAHQGEQPADIAGITGKPAPGY